MPFKKRNSSGPGRPSSSQGSSTVKGVDEQSTEYCHDSSIETLSNIEPSSKRRRGVTKAQRRSEIESQKTSQQPHDSKTGSFVPPSTIPSLLSTNTTRSEFQYTEEDILWWEQNKRTKISDPETPWLMELQKKLHTLNYDDIKLFIRPSFFGQPCKLRPLAPLYPKKGIRNTVSFFPCNFLPHPTFADEEKAPILFFLPENIHYASRFGPGEMELFIPLHDDRFSRFMESFRSKNPTKQRFYTQISTTYWDNTKKSIQPTRERRAIGTLDIITCEEFKISRSKTDILVIPVKQIVEPSSFHEPFSSDDFLMDTTKNISIGPMDLPYINDIFERSTEAVLTYVARNTCSASEDVQRRMFDILTMADTYSLYPPLPTYPRHYRHLAICPIEANSETVQAMLESVIQWFDKHQKSNFTNIEFIAKDSEQKIFMRRVIAESKQFRHNHTAIRVPTGGSGSCAFRAYCIALTGKDNNEDHIILRFFAMSLLRMLYRSGPSWQNWLEKNWQFMSTYHSNIQDYMDTMERNEESNSDVRNAHAQISYLIADITGRTVINIEIDEDESGEWVYIYKPGFSQKFGGLPPYSDDDELDHYNSRERLCELTLPSGQINYHYLFNYKGIQNPLVVWSNGYTSKHIEAVLLNENVGQYLDIPLIQLIREQTRFTIERANTVHHIHQPLMLSPQFTIPPTDLMDFRVYQTIMAKSMCPANSNHPLFKSIFSTPDFQSTHNECTVTHVDQNIGHAQLAILQDTVGGIPYFRALAIALTGHDNNTDYLLIRRFAILFLSLLCNQTCYWKEWLHLYWTYASSHQKMELYTYRTHKWVYGYRTHYDTERFNSTKAASIWEHVPLSIVTSEILGRFISVAIHEPENDDLYNTEYDEYRPEYVFSYSPGFAASYSIIKEACKSKFILKTHCLRNYAKPDRTLPDGNINYIFDQVDYSPLFEDPDCPNPLVIRWNGHGIYIPMLQEGQSGQYYTGSVRKLLLEKIGAAINRANLLNPGLPPLNIHSDLWLEDIHTDKFDGEDNSQITLEDIIGHEKVDAQGHLCTLESQIQSFQSLYGYVTGMPNKLECDDCVENVKVIKKEGKANTIFAFPTKF